MYYKYILLYDCSYTRIHIRTHACTHIHTYIYVHMSWQVENIYKFEAGGYGRCRCMYVGYGRCRWHKGHTYVSTNVTHTCISISSYVNMYTRTHLLGRSIRARSIATRASLAGCCNTASAVSGGLVCCSVLQYVGNKLQCVVTQPRRSLGASCVAVCCSVS